MLVWPVMGTITPGDFIVSMLPLSRMKYTRSVPEIAWLGREGEPAVPEGEGLLAEQPAPPAFERRHVGIVAGGDVLEVADDGRIDQNKVPNHLRVNEPALSTQGIGGSCGQ
jgi:hypothetical protein